MTGLPERTLRAVIYPDSDDVASPLGNGTDSTYDRVEMTYNRLGQPTTTKDQLQSVHSYDYDALGRQTQDRITSFGSGVDQAIKRIARTYEVRGMLSKVTSYDNATVGSGNIVNEVQLAYNDFAQLTQEYQEHAGAVNTSTSLKVQYTYADGSSSSNQIRPATLVYPNGRTISYDYGTANGIDDVISRIANLKESATTYASYSYLGGGTIVRIDYPTPDVRLDLWGGTTGTFAGLDRFGRVIDHKWYDYGASADRDRFAYGYDRNSSRTYKENTVTSAKDEFYAYDYLNRLASMDRGDLNGNKDAIADTPAIEQDWTLDPTGNWSAILTKAAGSTDLGQTRTHNTANETGVIGATVGTNWADPVHSLAGNMTSFPKPADPANSYGGTYDAWNRLVAVTDGQNTVATYTFDGQGRRIKKTIGNDTFDHYYTTSHQLLEVRKNADTDPLEHYVWSIDYIDSAVMRFRDSNTDGTIDDTLYVLHDANFNVTAVIDTNGDAQERYTYTPYGVRTILDGSWSSRGSSSYAWSMGHQGLLIDEETGLIYNRARMLHPGLGRFVQRDPLGYVDGMSLYTYIGNDPLNRQDASGLVWHIRRKAGTRALAQNDSKDDTIDDLATLIKLSASEYRIWLHPQNSGKTPATSSQRMGTWREFSVPNTAFLDNATYTWGWLGWWQIAASDDVEDEWRDEGLLVVDTNTYNTTVVLIGEHLRDENIYKYFFTGHGSNGALFDKDDVPFYPATYTKYGIADMRLVACQTNAAANIWATNVSRNGSLETWRGDITLCCGTKVVQPGTR